MSAPLAVGEFVGGAILVVASTEALVKGLVGVSRALRIAPFVASAVLSGLEAENVAVGLAAGHDHVAEIALGTVYGGVIFILTTAVGLGALIAPLHVRIPRSLPLLMVGAVALSGLPLVASPTPRFTGVVLLLGFFGAIAWLVSASRSRELLGLKEGPPEGRHATANAVVFALFGIAVITLGGGLVAHGASGLVSSLGVPAALIGMVVTPAVIESEEVIRQAVPAKMGRPDIAAGNLVGTVLYFTLFNLGLIALITPVAVSHATRVLDFPFAVGTALVVAALLLRGRVTRLGGLLLISLEALFVVLQLASVGKL